MEACLRAVGITPPPWLRYQKVQKSCAICGTDFSWLWLKLPYGCEACDRVVCSGCSSYRWQTIGVVTAVRLQLLGDTAGTAADDDDDPEAPVDVETRRRLVGRYCCVCLVRLLRSHDDVEPLSLPAEGAAGVVQAVGMAEEDIFQLQGALNKAQSELLQYSILLQEIIFNVVLNEENLERWIAVLREDCEETISEIAEVQRVKDITFSFPSIVSEAPMLGLLRYSSRTESRWTFRWHPKAWTLSIALEGKKIFRFAIDITVTNLQIEGVVGLAYAPDLTGLSGYFIDKPRLGFDISSAVSLGKVPLPLQDSIKRWLRARLERAITFMTWPHCVDFHNQDGLSFVTRTDYDSQPVPSSRPEGAVTTGGPDLDRLLRIQDLPSGHFELSQKLLGLLGIQPWRMLEHIPPVLDADHADDLRTWATAVVLAFFQMQLGGEMEQWADAAEAANRFLESHAGERLGVITGHAKGLFL